VRPITDEEKERIWDMHQAGVPKRVVCLPAQLRRSITYDHGPEMSEHVHLSVDTGVEVYFCDPKPSSDGINHKMVRTKYKRA
jgi:IS30 family transposase